MNNDLVQAKLTPKSKRTLSNYDYLNSELTQIAQKAMSQMSEQFQQLAMEDLVEILRQIIKSGDIIRYTTIPKMVYENEVLVTNSAQKLVYIPYQRELDLETRIRELESKIDRLKGMLNENKPNFGRIGCSNIMDKRLD